MKKIFFLLQLFVILLYSNELQKVSLQLRWKSQFQFAGFYIAQEKGFYKDVGLDVDIREYKNNINIIDSVVDMNSTFGVEDSQLVYHKLKGKPVVALMCMFQQSPLVLLSIANRGINNLKDLDGKTIETNTNLVFDAAMSAIFATNDIHIKHKSPTFGVDDLIHGKTDVLNSYISNEPYLLIQKGYQLKIFKPRDYGFDFYGDMLFTSEKMIKTDPQTVAKFYQASKLGWEYAFSHIDETVDIILKYFNTQHKTKDSLIYEANALKKLSGINKDQFGKLSSEKIRNIGTTFALLFPDNYNLDILNDFIYSPKNLSTNNKILLSQAEKDFLLKHPKIVLGTDATWKPYVIVNNDHTISGYDQDVLNLINKVSGANFVLKTGKWADMQNEANKNIIDGLSTGGIHEERKKYLNFSDIYISMQKMIVTSTLNNIKINSLKDVEGKTIAIYKDNLVEEKTAKRFKNVKILKLNSVREVIQSVITGKADIMFGNGATIYYANELGLPYLKLAYGLDDKLELAFGVRKDWPLAINIINKSLQQIGTQQLLSLKHKWFLGKQLNQPQDIFTKNEMDYLQSKKTIKVCCDTTFNPFIINSNNGLSGISIDYLNLISKKYNIDFEYIKTNNWKEHIDLLKKHVCDIVPVVIHDKSHCAYSLNMSNPYIQDEIVLVTKLHEPFINDFHKIKNKKIGIKKGIVNLKTYVQNLYPNFHIVEIENDFLEKVADGELFGFVAPSLQMSYLIAHNYSNNLKIMGIVGDKKIDMSIGININENILKNIIDKAIQNISNNEKQTILKNWIRIQIDKDIDYSFILNIVEIFLVLLLIGIIVLLILNNNNKMLKNVIDSTIEGIIITKNGICINANEQAGKLLGYDSPTQLLDQNILDFAPEEDREIIKERMKSNQEPYEGNITKKDGTIIPILVKGTFMNNNSTRITSFIDLSELKTTQKELERLNASLQENINTAIERNKQQELMMIHQSRLAQMGEILSMIAHQWRQPLNNVSLIIQGLIIKYKRAKLTDEYVEKFKQDSKQQIQEMSSTIDNFRDFFKPEKEIVGFDLSKNIEHTISILEPVLKQLNIKIELILDNDIQLYGYPNELGQSMINIINNAKDALVQNNHVMDRKVTIITLIQDTKTIIQIEDNAGGIPDGIIHNIFDPYFSTKEDKNGTGLGLYMTKIMIEEHMNGKVEVQNGNSGAIFKIIFK